MREGGMMLWYGEEVWVVMFLDSSTWTVLGHVRCVKFSFCRFVIAIPDAAISGPSKCYAPLRLEGSSILDNSTEILYPVTPRSSPYRLLLSIVGPLT